MCSKRLIIIHSLIPEIKFLSKFKINDVVWLALHSIICAGITRLSDLGKKGIVRYPKEYLR